MAGPLDGYRIVEQGAGVTIKGRHRALGDAMAAAEIFSRLLPRLRDADVRTLGEAQSFAASRSDLEYINSKRVGIRYRGRPRSHRRLHR